MTTTRTRSRGRVDSRSSAAREGAERRPAVLVSAGIGIVLLAFVLIVTPTGRVVLTATDHFLLKYGGVFALLALTGSVCMGVVATDRIVMAPGHRVLAQAVHRSVSFGALAFLIIHIVLEITAPHLEESTTQHVHLLDAFIPFLSQYRTFYMAEGTIASDIIVLLVITGIIRRRFTASGHAWKWRIIHYSSYAALILGVLHGLLAGRKAIGSFVYWSYGIVIALVALAVLVRILASSLSTRDQVKGASPQSDLSRSGGDSMPARAAALGLMGQLTGTMPLAGANRAIAVVGTAGMGTAGMGAAGMGAGTAGMGAAGALTAPFGAGGPVPLAEPAAPRAIAALPGSAPAGPGGPGADGRPPRYEPGYVGPPRYEGAPAPRPEPEYGTGPQPAYGAGSRPPGRSGPQPGPGTGPMPQAGTGPMPRIATGPQPVYRDDPAGFPPGSPSGSPSAPAAGPPNGRPAGPPPGYGLDPREAAYGPGPRYQLDPGPRYEPDPGPRYAPDAGYGSDAGYGPGYDRGYGPGEAPYGPGEAAYGPGQAPYGLGQAPYGPAEAPYSVGEAPYRAGEPPYGAGGAGGAPYGYAGAPYGPGEAPYEADGFYEPGPPGGYDQGYGAPPPPPSNGYAGASPQGGPRPPDQPGHQGQPRPGRRQRPASPNVHERTGPLPRVPSYGGDERR